MAILNDENYDVRKLFEYMEEKAYQHSSCVRRQNYCLLLDKQTNIIGEGANGTPIVLGDCRNQIDICPSRDVPAGKGDSQTLCYGVHSEIRALKDCKDISSIRYCLSLKAPCRQCVLTLMTTPCEEIVFMVPSTETINKELWEKVKCRWTHYER
ncbi:MAG: hypothetical protein ACREBU_00290 [Nitrososphaera sp.]